MLQKWVVLVKLYSIITQLCTAMPKRLKRPMYEKAPRLRFYGFEQKEWEQRVSEVRTVVLTTSIFQHESEVRTVVLSAKNNAVSEHEHLSTRSFPTGIRRAAITVIPNTKPFHNTYSKTADKVQRRWDFELTLGSPVL